MLFQQLTPILFTFQEEVIVSWSWKCSTPLFFGSSCGLLLSSGVLGSCWLWCCYIELHCKVCPPDLDKIFTVYIYHIDIVLKWSLISKTETPLHCKTVNKWINKPKSPLLYLLHVKPVKFTHKNSHFLWGLNFSLYLDCNCSCSKWRSTPLKNAFQKVAQKTFQIKPKHGRNWVDIQQKIRWK